MRFACTPDSEPCYLQRINGRMMHYVGWLDVTADTVTGHYCAELLDQWRTDGRSDAQILQRIELAYTVAAAAGVWLRLPDGSRLIYVFEPESAAAPS